jgi:hypothetical protein
MSQISPQHSDESTLYFTGKEDYAQQARTKLHLSAGRYNISFFLSIGTVLRSLLHLWRPVVGSIS